MFTKSEIQTAVDVHAPNSGIVVRIGTEYSPTFETEEVDGKRRNVRSDNGQFVPRRDAAGKHILHPKNHAQLTIPGSPVAIRIDLEQGESESPHEHTRRDVNEMAEIVKRATGALLKETARAPLSATEFALMTQEQAKLAAQRAATDRLAHAKELRAAMSSTELAAADYHAEHGEPDFFASGLYLEAHERHLTSAVILGAVTNAEATTERQRIVSWRERSVKRRANGGK